MSRIKCCIHEGKIGYKGENTREATAKWPKDHPVKKVVDAVAVGIC